MEEACSTAWGKARLCRVTRRCHDATLTGPSRQLLMPTWKVAHLIRGDGGREDSHSHRSATVRERERERERENYPRFGRSL